MDFPWYTYKGGQGGIPGGGGASWFWTEEEPSADEEYYSDCGNGTPLPFLGYLFDIEEEPLSCSILTEEAYGSDNVYYYVYQSFTKILDVNLVSGRETEYSYLQNYPVLVVPEDTYNRAQVVSLSSKQSEPQLQVYKFSFDGATYFCPVGCFPGTDALVRQLRGAAYIESLEIGEQYYGISGTLAYKSQNMLITPTLLPGRLSGFGGFSGGGGTSGTWSSEMEKLGVRIEGKEDNEN